MRHRVAAQGACHALQASFAFSSMQCSCTRGPTIVSYSLEWSSSGPTLWWCGPASRCRPLIHVCLQETVTPFQEEQWVKFAITSQGSSSVLATFSLARKCTRCEMINIHPETGDACPSQPLSLIKRHRTAPPQFGTLPPPQVCPRCS